MYIRSIEYLINTDITDLIYVCKDIYFSEIFFKRRY